MNLSRMPSDNEYFNIESYFSLLFSELKKGKSTGIIINNLFDNSTHQFLEELQSQAVNNGFADIPSENELKYYISDFALKISQSARNYNTFDDFQKRNEKSQINHHSITNKNISIVGDIKDSQINYESDLRESSFINTKNINNSPAKNEAEPSIKDCAKDIFKKYWWGLVIPLILLIIGYLIEYKSGFFIKSNP